ncbi:MAG TPA: GPW/gp25 family protein [Allosphingosinicella sp.]
MALPVRPDFLGRGWSFPPSFSKALASAAMVADLEDIRQSLWVLFGTAPGERVMLPTYGCDLWKYVFRELNTSLLNEISDVVAAAIIRWETRIQLLSVTATVDPEQAGLVLIDVTFLVRAINTRSNLVYPFYLTEATLAGGS